MIIAITGHTSGIGKAIADLFESKGHKILGFSRSTGHDITEFGTISRIAKEANHADVFINNAFFRMVQVDMLYAVHELWKHEPKTIINIASNAPDLVKDYAHPYSVFKSALDKATEQVQHIPAICRVMNLRPGYVDTARVAHIGAKKLLPENVATTVEWMVENPFLTKNLTMQPWPINR